MFWEVLLDGLIDTLKVLPILYLVYLLVAYLGHNNNNKYANLMSKTKKYGPIIGGMTGSLPQCGFSIVMSDLYSRRAITLGTLIAVFISTSDEAIPIMLSEPNMILPLVCMIAIKLVFAVLFGYAVDLVIKLFGKKQQTAPEVFEQIHNEHCELTSCHHIPDDHSCAEKTPGACCSGHVHHEEHSHPHCCARNIFLDALLHTLSIAAFLFVSSVLIGFVVELWGIQNLQKFFGQSKWIQPFFAGIVGLIPSCASSVFLVELYIAGAIEFGALLAGLSVGCGVGLLVLFTKNRKHIWQNLLIVLLLYVLGVIVGQLGNLLPLNFV